MLCSMSTCYAFSALQLPLQQFHGWAPTPRMPMLSCIPYNFTLVLPWRYWHNTTLCNLSFIFACYYVCNVQATTLTCSECYGLQHIPIPFHGGTWGIAEKCGPWSLRGMLGRFSALDEKLTWGIAFQEVAKNLWLTTIGYFFYLDLIIHKNNILLLR